MRIEGKWLWCDDGVVRPIIEGEVLAGDGSWRKAEFLLDTGADRTVLSAPILASLGLAPIRSDEHLGGLGGLASSVTLSTQLRLTRDGGGKVVFRGEFAAVTKHESLDVCVLGRDILAAFAVIVDLAGDLVCLLGQRHGYSIVQR